MIHELSTTKMNSKHILLTGGTGLIGGNLTEALLAKGYTVSHLSRSSGKDPKIKTFLWDVDRGEIDEQCINGVDTIIHLAGAGIADKRWTDERKKVMINSRVKSIELIYDLLRRKNNQVKSVISASAIGYYSDRGEELLTEGSPPANDFLARCCVEWEAAVDEGQKLDLRIVKFRTGVVLDEGGALAKMAAPVKLYIGSPLGNGKQWIPWIHNDDVVGMYLYAVENKDLTGVYNMVAPNPVTNAQITKAIAVQLNKPLWMPNVPAIILKLALGEMSTIVLGSTKVSAQKIETEGFKFKYQDIASALKEIYG